MPSKYVSMLIKPASSACDMRCRYCFYRDVAEHREHAVGARMDEATMRAVVDRALELAPDASVTFAFQGGEPTLAGLDFFRGFVAYVGERRERQQVRYSIQTNGLSLDEEWVAFLRENGFLVGVSVDGYRDLHDRLRPDASGKGTYARVMAGVRRLREAGVEFNVLAVLTEQMARHPQRAFQFLLREGIDYVQFTPCLAGLEGEGAEYALTPRSFCRFYRSVFDMWRRELERGHYVSVGLFDNVMEMSLGQYPHQCGMLGRCAPQFVVESTGDVYPCDFYALDEYRVGNVRDESLEAMAASRPMRDFLDEPRRACSACDGCRFEGICHRNCKRLNSAYYDDDYCGYREFLDYAYDGLAAAARMLASR